MTVNIPSRVAEIKLDMVELKLDRLIDEMRFLKSHTIAFDTRMRGIEAYLKASEPSEQRPESKPTPWLAAAASATARTGVVVYSRSSSRGSLDQALSGNMT